jgi:formimidoylglutamase
VPKRGRQGFGSLSKLKGKTPIQVQDFGDVKLSGTDVNLNHQNAASAITQVLNSESDSALVVVGGGHDHGYSHLLGIRNALPADKKMGCLNIDAHFDLRRPNPEPSSGSPFYLAIESGILLPEHFVEFGIQDSANGPELWAYAESKNILTYMFRELREDPVKRFEEALLHLETRVDEIVISLDLDALRQSDAPGVSAPSSEGFFTQDIFQMMDAAARHPKVRSLGIFELNPAFDRDDQTARVAAQAAWRFWKNVSI